ELTEAGLHCIGCPASSFESLWDGCAVHGMPDEQIEGLIKKLNERILEIEKEKSAKKGAVEKKGKNAGKAKGKKGGK
ncbi:MAG: DUF1858 domain-containing protein, partial [Candidatus Micrarchaeota archaeon]